MRLPTYTFQAIRAAKLAGRRAARAGAKRVEPEHLLLALLAEREILTRVLVELGIDPVNVRSRARELAQAQRVGRRTSPRLSGRMEKILFGAEAEANSLGERTIQTHHLLLALLREDGPAAQFLIEYHATYDVIRRAIRKVLNLPSPRRCSKCGYDLRATPLRCPECGEMI